MGGEIRPYTHAQKVGRFLFYSYLTGFLEKMLCGGKRVTASRGSAHHDVLKGAVVLDLKDIEIKELNALRNVKFL